MRKVDSGTSMVDFARLPIPVVPYTPVCRSGSGISVMSLEDLLEKVPQTLLSSPHRLGFHEILLVTEGTGIFSVDSSRIECRPGSLLWLRPNQIVRYAPQPGMKGEVILFTEAFPLPMQATVGTLDDVLRPSFWQLEEPEMGQLGRVLDLLREEFRCPERMMGEHVLQHLLSVVLLTVTRVCRSRQERRLPQEEIDHRELELFQRFRQDLDRSFHHTRRVEYYATALNCTSHALSRACRTVIGTSAKGVIDARVALEARRLLAHTRLPIGAVARQLGFTEVSNFTKFFIRLVQMTPGAFRRVHGVNFDG
ncbi:helix-turn-helix domain-containing protein [Streptomyces griseorubiginosus]|uniref:helix-turn-helix domain-containing protein n=1 Tax=Streptomyces griseorubiginosus TaxID=67304 RepID=UPI0036F12293